MMYEVIKKFTDLQDGNHVYNVGDTYPREGYTPSEERITELATDKNRQKTPLIAEILSEDVEISSEDTEEISEDAEETENVPENVEPENSSRKRKGTKE